MKIENLTIHNKYAYYKRNISFNMNNDLVDEGDYVKISKKKYNRDTFWKRVDIAIASSVIAYWLYKAFKL